MKLWIIWYYPQLDVLPTQPAGGPPRADLAQQGVPALRGAADWQDGPAPSRAREVVAGTALRPAGLGPAAAIRVEPGALRARGPRAAEAQEGDRRRRDPE